MALLEVTLIFITLLSLGTIGVYRLKESYSMIRLDCATEELIKKLEMAKGLALRSRRKVTFCVYPMEENKWCLKPTQLSLDRLQVPSICLSDTAIKLEGYSQGLLTFSGDENNATGRHYILRLGDYRIRVIISSRARISRCVEGSTWRRIKACA